MEKVREGVRKDEKEEMAKKKLLEERWKEKDERNRNRRK